MVPPPAAGLVGPGMMVPPMVSNIVSSVDTSITTTTISNPVPILPSPAKGLNALLGLPTPSLEPLVPGMHPSMSQIGRTESEEMFRQPGEEMVGPGVGQAEAGEGETIETVEMEMTEMENGTEEIEIAEVVNEESGQNEMLIITESKGDNQVN